MSPTVSKCPHVDVGDPTGGGRRFERCSRLEPERRQSWGDFGLSASCVGFWVKGFGGGWRVGSGWLRVEGFEMGLRVEGPVWPMLFRV
jgi:hypothetical protein